MARGKQQRPHERLIPREVFEARQADEARRRAWRARGDDSDDLTVSIENEETNNEENLDDHVNIVQVGQGNDNL